MKSIILTAILFFTATPIHADTQIVYQTIAYESSGESFEGQVAVASVIKTRAFKRHLSAKEVCLQAHQFSAWDVNGNPTQKRKLTSKEIESAKKAWEQAKVWQFNHYHTTNIKPSWAKYSVEAVIIGSHIFHRLSK